MDDAIMDVLEEAERLKMECRHSEAIALLEGILLDDPENVPALEEIADNELSLEQYDRAETAARRAVALEPESYTGHYILGFLASLQEQWNMALKELQAANKLKSNNPEILRCLGWVLFNANNRVQGIVTLERALNLDPENTLSLCDLGVCYLHIHNFQKAKTLFKRALDLEPENERARECVHAVEKFHQ